MDKLDLWTIILFVIPLILVVLWGTWVIARLFWYAEIAPYLEQRRINKKLSHYSDLEKTVYTKEELLRKYINDLLSGKK